MLVQCCTEYFERVGGGAERIYILQQFVTSLIHNILKLIVDTLLNLCRIQSLTTGDKTMNNRYKELGTLKKILINSLINTTASETIDELVLHRIIREAQTKIREG